MLCVANAWFSFSWISFRFRCQIWDQTNAIRIWITMNIATATTIPVVFKQTSVDDTSEEDETPELPLPCDLNLFLSRSNISA